MRAASGFVLARSRTFCCSKVSIFASRLVEPCFAPVPVSGGSSSAREGVCHKTSYDAYPETFGPRSKFGKIPRRPDMDSAQPLTKKLFPLFLKLEGRKCLIVGAGKIGESKVASLLDTAAVLQVVAPRATSRIRTWARNGKIRWQKRKFRDSDLTGCFLVVAATPSRTLHERIFRLAKRRNVICNVVDVPEFCDFYYPATVQRGALQIAVSTGGESPALAQRLRKQFESQFGPEYEEWLKHLGEERQRIRAQTASGPQRNKRLHQMASELSFQKFLESRKK
jgi:precorrin-2 dehydrogenase / sirohydrochlorin ferrochelatase